jgi:hypothetical protein
VCISSEPRLYTEHRYAQTMFLSRFKNATLLMHLYYTFSKCLFFCFFWVACLVVKIPPTSTLLLSRISYTHQHDQSRFQSLHLKSINQSRAPSIQELRLPKFRTGDRDLLDMGGNCRHSLGKIPDRYSDWRFICRCFFRTG